MSNETEIKKFLEDSIKQIRSRALSIIEIEAKKSIKKNFQAGGRPNKWKPSKKNKKTRGTKTLVVSGNLSNVSAVKNVEAGTVTLRSNPLAKAYARIHQEGGRINHPSRPVKHRRTKSGRTVFASSRHKRITGKTMTKPYTVRMPARPYMVIPESDIRKWTRLIVGVG